ncbi:MAG: MFS transporter [Phocaeicola vulgatus]|nr:MFS transporter [Phocaeicola vulgatus]
MKNEITGMKLRLIVMNFLQFAVWGAYLTSMGTYLFNIGLGAKIGLFYAMQGIVSLFMPAIMGIIADRWVPAQKLYGFCHFMAAVFMVAAGWYGYVDGEAVNFGTLFTFYSLSVAFYMPTLALTNSVAYTALDKVKLDPVIAFPPIRIFGTIGFICSMLLTDILGFQNNYMQFFSCACFGVILAVYALTLPAEYADTFGVNHANALISLSQVSETLCILLIPFVLKHFGIKRVMLIAMLAWVLRFGLFGLGNPGPGVWMFVLSMIVYGVAFDFFNISGSLFVNNETDLSIRSSAQGLFVIMTNGIGATVGTLGAQAVVNRFVDMNSSAPQMEGWSMTWFVFAGYALAVAVLFAVIFKYKHRPGQV